MAGYLRYKIYGKWVFIIAEKKFCYLKNCFDKVETFFLLNSTAMKNLIRPSLIPIYFLGYYEKAIREAISIT